MSSVGPREAGMEAVASTSALLARLQVSEEEIEEDESSLPLLALPDPCLLAVLGFCAADDQRSLFSAARTHSRLHQAAVAALRSISAERDQAAGVLAYLDRHGSQINGLKLQGRGASFITVPQLPTSLQLHSLELGGCSLQSLPGHGFRGVLGAAVAAGAPPLKQLRLNDCRLLDRVGSIASALLQLLALEHLSLRRVKDDANVYHDVDVYDDASVDDGVSVDDSVLVHDDVHVVDDAHVEVEMLDYEPLYNDAHVAHGRSAHRGYLPTRVLEQLQQLTYLELADVELKASGKGSPALQPLQALSRLVDLRLAFTKYGGGIVTADMLASACHLTCMAVVLAELEPATLAGKVKLQHLALIGCSLMPQLESAGVAALLSQLQQLTQLTHLDLASTMFANQSAHQPPRAAYAALTASSNLHHLSISGCRIRANVLQHPFPAGRQLPHLTSLDISRVTPCVVAPAQGASSIVECCPSLQVLDVSRTEYSGAMLSSLSRLRGLQTLHLGYGCPLSPQLMTELQQLQQLRHLTALYTGHLTALHVHSGYEVLKQEGPGDEPVWRQLLRQFLGHSYRDVSLAVLDALTQ